MNEGAPSDLPLDRTGLQATLDGSAPLSPFQRGNSLVVVFDDPAAESVVRHAVALWRVCRKRVSGMPDVVAFDVRDSDGGGREWSDFGDRRLDVVVADLSNDRRCGAFKGAGIQIFRRARKRAGGFRSCGSLGQNLAHEVGHAFGLEDHPREIRWQHAIMSRLHPGNLFSRKVEAFECRAVDQLWQTDDEAGTVGVGTR